MGREKLKLYIEPCKIADSKDKKVKRTIMELLKPKSILSNLSRYRKEDLGFYASHLWDENRKSKK